MVTETAKPAYPSPDLILHFRESRRPRFSHFIWNSAAFLLFAAGIGSVGFWLNHSQVAVVPLVKQAVLVGLGFQKHEEEMPQQLHLKRCEMHCHRVHVESFDLNQFAAAYNFRSSGIGDQGIVLGLLVHQWSDLLSSFATIGPALVPLDPTVQGPGHQIDRLYSVGRPLFSP
jgi:hypothetical protein